MSLQPCRECGKEVSSDAFSCPACGAPRPTARVWKGFGIDWKSRTTLFGIPLVHVAIGFDARRRPKVARGIIAIGQFAVGVVTIAQFGIGLLFGLGQFLLGFVVVAQVAGGVLLGVGQLSTGVLAIGQIVAGIYGLCQGGIAKYMWSSSRVDMEAVAMFSTIEMKLRALLGF